MYRVYTTLKSYELNKMCNVTLKDSCGKGDNIDRNHDTYIPHIPSPQLKIIHPDCKCEALFLFSLVASQTSSSQ